MRKNGILFLSVLLVACASQYPASPSLNEGAVRAETATVDAVTHVDDAALAPTILLGLGDTVRIFREDRPQYACRSGVQLACRCADRLGQCDCSCPLFLE